MSKIGYNQGNNPFKQTLGTHTAPGGTAHGKRGGTYNKNTAARPETEQEREARHKRSQNFINYLDMNDDGKASACSRLQSPVVIVLSCPSPNPN